MRKRARGRPLGGKERIWTDSIVTQSPWVCEYRSPLEEPYVPEQLAPNTVADETRHPGTDPLLTPEMDESILPSRFRRLIPDLTNALEALPSPPVRYNPFPAPRIREATALRGRARRRPAAR